MKLAWFVGVDWGSQKHQACVLDCTGKVLGERLFEHSGAGLSEMADWLLSFTQGEAAEVGVAIETPRGPVVNGHVELNESRLPSGSRPVVVSCSGS